MKVRTVLRLTALTACLAASLYTTLDRAPDGAALAAAPDTAKPDGQKIASEKCAECHTFQSTGPLDAADLARSKGPTLAYAGSKFKSGWLAAWLAAPRRIRPAGYLPYRYVVSTPDGDRVDTSLLPQHPSLSADEAAAVADYLSTLKKETTLTQPPGVETGIRAQVHFDKILGCGSCHQARDGQGGLSGPELYTAPGRLNEDWALAYISDPTSWSSGYMPKPSIRGDQLAVLGDYLFQRAPKPDGSKSQMPVAAAKLPSAPASGGQAQAPNQRAQLLYEVYCSQCHGVQGNGKGINAPFMFIAPRNHTSREEMGALTDERIYQAIKLGGNAVGKSAMMPAWRDVLKDADIQLLVEYLRLLSGTGPAGER